MAVSTQVAQYAQRRVTKRLMRAVPFLGALGQWAMVIFMLGLACSHALSGIGTNAWMSWMSVRCWPTFLK